MDLGSSPRHLPGGVGPGPSAPQGLRLSPSDVGLRGHPRPSQEFCPSQGQRGDCSGHFEILWGWASLGSSRHPTLLPGLREAPKAVVTPRPHETLSNDCPPGVQGSTRSSSWRAGLQRSGNKFGELNFGMGDTWKGRSRAQVQRHGGGPSWHSGAQQAPRYVELKWVRWCSGDRGCPHVQPRGGRAAGSLPRMRFRSHGAHPPVWRWTAPCKRAVWRA